MTCFSVKSKGTFTFYTSWSSSSLCSLLQPLATSSPLRSIKAKRRIVKTKNALQNMYPIMY